jgi:hypothetical protein
VAADFSAQANSFAASTSTAGNAFSRKANDAQAAGDESLNWWRYKDTAASEIPKTCSKCGTSLS